MNAICSGVRFSPITVYSLSTDSGEYSDIGQEQTLLEVVNEATLHLRIKDVSDGTAENRKNNDLQITESIVLQRMCKTLTISKVVHE